MSLKAFSENRRAVSIVIGVAFAAGERGQYLTPPVKRRHSSHSRRPRQSSRPATVNSRAGQISRSEAIKRLVEHALAPT